MEMGQSCGFGEQRLVLIYFIKDGDDVFSMCERLEWVMWSPVVLTGSEK